LPNRKPGGQKRTLPCFCSMAPLRYAKYLHEKIVGSHLVLIPQAAHTVMAEQPALLNKAVEMFLDESVA
jgi:pimeloyl-ACP methyl ester carboxylesterase